MCGLVRLRLCDRSVHGRSKASCFFYEIKIMVVYGRYLVYHRFMDTDLKMRPYDSGGKPFFVHVLKKNIFSVKRAKEI